ncbi:anti-sigma factor family protein [Salinithrix halophila]|uniref:Anti-sigma-W factor RsiW n=1 Tax=Salinithrix halophila TaxID=1485204 RepID=A0ABV8JCQ9_9BACL
MRCPISDETLLAFHLGELLPHMRDEVQEHLENCPECSLLAKELDQWKVAWDDPEVAPSDEWVDRVMEALPDLEAAPPPSRRRFFRAYSSLKRSSAAHFLTALAATVVFIVSDAFQWIPHAWFRLSGTMGWVGLKGDDLVPLIQYQIGKFFS